LKAQIAFFFLAFENFAACAKIVTLKKKRRLCNFDDSFFLLSAEKEREEACGFCIDIIQVVNRLFKKRSNINYTQQHRASFPSFQKEEEEEQVKIDTRAPLARAHA